jgi:hypothetical protein
LSKQENWQSKEYIWVKFDRKKKPKKGEIVKQNQFKKWFQTKNNSNKKKWGQIWEMKKFKRDEIEKAYRFYISFKIK